MCGLIPLYSCTGTVPGPLIGCKLLNRIGLSGTVQPHSRFWRRGRHWSVNSGQWSENRSPEPAPGSYPGVGGGGVTKALTAGDGWAEGFGTPLRAEDSQRSPLVVLCRQIMYMIHLSGYPHPAGFGKFAHRKRLRPRIYGKISVIRNLNSKFRRTLDLRRRALRRRKTAPGRTGL